MIACSYNEVHLYSTMTHFDHKQPTLVESRNGVILIDSSSEMIDVMQF